MKYFLFLLALTISQTILQAQTSLVNLKAGTWKNSQTWLYQRIPSDTDHVVLMQDIVVDTNAVCRSLTSNGFNIMVADGFHLSITGRDTSTSVDNDTLVSAISIIYQSSGTLVDTRNIPYRKYDYDALKRVRTIDETSTSSSAKIRTYHYLGNNIVPFMATFLNLCDFRDKDICYPRYDTTLYTYNNEGIVIKEVYDSKRFKPQLNSKFTNEYEILGDSVFKYSCYNSFATNPDNPNEPVKSFHNDTTRFFKLLENGDIVHQYDSSSLGYDRHNRTYDKMKNPIYRASIHLPVLPKETLLFEDPEQINNSLITEETYNIYTSKNFRRFSKLYKYKANGYPIELFLPDFDGANSFAVLKFYYTK